MSMGISAGTAAAIGGGMVLGGLLSGGSKGSTSPDPGVASAATTNAKTAADTLAWYKNLDAQGQPARDQASQLALSQAQTQNNTAGQLTTAGNDTSNYATDTFRPIDSKIASDAIGYDTPARRDAAAAQAQSDIGTAADAGNANMARDVMSRGGDVNSGNFTASLANANVQQAAAKAAAGNQARLTVEATGAKKLADAATLGSTVANTGLAQTQLGVQTGNSAVANSTVPGNIAAQEGATMATGVNSSTGANTAAGNLLLGQYQAVNTANQNANSTTNALLGAAGSAFGGWAGGGFKTSDKNKKNSRKKISGQLSLAQVKKLPPNETWRYNKGAVPGDNGQLHEGHMAQDVNKVMGEHAAPGGKVINLEHMAATGLAAIKEVSKKQDKIASRVLSLENARAKRRA